MNENKMNIYLDEIGREKLLTEAQERDLSARIAKGDERALNRLVETNLRFVVSIARQYQGRGLSVDDLVSEGNVGLMKAAVKYDATRGVRFAPFAAPYVRRSIERALLRESGERRVESRKNGATRSVDASLGNRSNVSLLSVLADTGTPDTAQRTYDGNAEKAVEYALAALNERESQVVKAFFGLGQEHQTMQEIADDMGLKRERVRQIRNQAVRKLRKSYRRHLAGLRD